MSEIILNQAKGSASVLVVQVDPKRFVIVRRNGESAEMWSCLSKTFAVSDAISWLRWH